MIVGPYLYCDHAGCGLRYGVRRGRRNPTVLRQEAQARGWTRTDAAGDLCPAHARAQALDLPTAAGDDQVERIAGEIVEALRRPAP